MLSANAAADFAGSTIIGKAAIAQHLMQDAARTAPKANAFCERLIGTIRRECLDFLLPINERHLRGIVKEFVTHYNRGRPHSSLGPGIPEPFQASAPAGPHRHKLPAGYGRFAPMNMAWKRRLRESGLSFCAPQGNHSRPEIV